MRGDQKRLILPLIFAMIFGAVIFGALAGQHASAQDENPGSRPPRVVQTVRNADDYFAKMSDREITTRAHVVCGLLRSGTSVETVVGIEARTMSSSHVGVLLDSAVSSYCPEYRATLHEFIERHS